MQEPLTNLRQFAFSEAFCLSFNNSLAFTGTFIDHSRGSVIGKQLFIPLSEKHQALTFIITSTSFSKSNELDSLIVYFESIEERDLIAKVNFSNEIFFVEK